MSREVDIKALVSHLVLGNGMDKCRICMGDTSEGQVYLGDTVMTDGDRPITLAELLETITGVEVEIQEDLPSGLCLRCSKSALDAAGFLTLCHQAANQWNDILSLLLSAPTVEMVPKDKSLFFLIGDNQLIIIKDGSSTLSSCKMAALRLKQHLAPKSKKPQNQSHKKYITKIKNGRQRENYIKSHQCQCPTCGKKFSYAQHLFQHLKESTDLKRACHVCAEIMSRDDLIGHLRHIHGIKPYDCKKCPALFRSNLQYIKHLEQAHRPGMCTCGDCGRSFSSSHAYHAHLSVHTLKICPGCDSSFRNQTCYLHHVKKCCNLDKNRQDTHRTKHKVTVEVRNKKSERRVQVGMRGSADKECICDYCGKKFAGKKFVGAHIQIVHMKNTHTPCIYCGKFLAAAHMTEHMKTHEQLRSYKCEHCSIILKSRLGYVQHLRLHTGEKPYACKHCGETFPASSRRSEHIRKTHNTKVVLRHACELCPAKFQLPYRLKKHIATVHDQKELLTLFECNVCHEKFSSCRGLLHHSRKHQQRDTKKNKAPEIKVISELIEDEMDL